MAKELLGHIDCPHCGWEKGMRVTLDKSGAPFGYCEANCNGQMRVGGNAARVSAFMKRHPHLVMPGAAPAVVEPAPLPVVKAEPAPAPKSVKVAAPPKAPEAKPVPPKAPSFFEQLAGVKA